MKTIGLMSISQVTIGIADRHCLDGKWVPVCEFKDYKDKFLFRDSIGREIYLRGFMIPQVLSDEMFRGKGFVRPEEEPAGKFWKTFWKCEYVGKEK